MAPLVTVSIVTFNSRLEIERCLDCLFAQTGVPLEIVIWDNASTDGTAEYLQTISHPAIRVLPSLTNMGFCAAHNRVIKESKAEFVLVLNPDCYLEPDYLPAAIEAARSEAEIGAVAGKLYRLRDPRQPFVDARKEGVLDSAGIYFTPSLRHFDRGSNELEGDRFNATEWVFGVTGAAALYRREMLEAIRIHHEYFDEDFFAYREDADLAWRMQSAGWKCLFTPKAVGYHVRKVLPTDRSAVASQVNMHSVKNRFLFRLNNVSWLTAIRFFVPMFLRDCAVIGYALLVEHSSLPGLWFILRHLPGRWNRRRLIQKKRKVSWGYLHQWIRWKATAFQKSENSL
jgi:GT2 family glycosyltransferase